MFHRKLMINIIVFVVCGVIALTIPVFVNYWKTTSTSATKPTTYTLTSTFVGEDSHLTDARIMWQICLMNNEIIVLTWENIYQNINNYPLIFDNEHLILTPNGLCYRGLATTQDYENLYATGYSSTVTYKNYTCTLTLK